MQSFLFVNSFFEEELIRTSSLTPLENLEKHPVYFQLQYLTLLVAESFETPLLSHAPDPKYLDPLKSLGFSVPSFALLSDTPTLPASLSSWGASKSLKTWALEKTVSYKIPALDLVKKIQSKEFCFKNFPQLQGSALISSLEDLTSWWYSFKTPKVLKTLYGSSGRGHHISYDNDFLKARAFFKRNPTLIAQPWVERVLDFSTQWVIQEDGSSSYLGSTLCKNTSRGIYLTSTVGPDELLFKDNIDFLKEHLMFAKKAIEQLAALSFFGNVGFDAFIYIHPSTKKMQLFPVVEINARKTMGWTALQIAKKLSRCDPLSISYRSNEEKLPGLLPSHKDFRLFPKQLVLESDRVCI